MNTTTDNPPRVPDVARAVAALMPGWAVKRDPRTETEERSWADLVHTSGAELSLGLRSGTRPGQMHVRGTWPRRTANGAYGEFVPGDTAQYAINVSLAKSPEQIARDIGRRLEGPYLAEYAKQCETMRSTIAAEAGAKVAAAHIAASIGTTAREDSRRTDLHTISLFNVFGGRRGSGELKVSRTAEDEPANVDLTLTGITPEEAITILAVLRADLRATAIAAVLDTTATGGEA